MLTDMTIRQTKATNKPYAIADFDGLYLHISAVGDKAWHFRYTWLGQPARISLEATLSCRFAKPVNCATRHARRSPGV